MATKCILIKNMLPDTRDNNEYLLSYMLLSHNIRFKKVTCPTDKNGSNSSHAFIEFDSDHEIAWTAQYLDGYLLWCFTGDIRVLRAKIRPAQEQAWKEAHAERSWWDEKQAWKEAHAEARTNSTPPHIYEMSSHSSSAASAASAASRTPTVITETYCIYCNNTTHSTKNCRKLHYKWSKHNYICKHCVNIPGCMNVTHPISYKNVIVCPRLIRDGMAV